MGHHLILVAWWGINPQHLVFLDILWTDGYLLNLFHSAVDGWNENQRERALKVRRLRYLQLGSADFIKLDVSSSLWNDWLFGLSHGQLNLPREWMLCGSGHHRPRIEALDNVSSPKIPTGDALAEGLSLEISRRRCRRLCLRSHHLRRKWAALDLCLNLLAHSCIYRNC